MGVKRVIFATQKGGAGKTTSTAIASEILAASGYRVLVVDFDSQGNATKMLSGKSIYQFSGRTIMEAIQEGNAEPYIYERSDNLHLIPAEDKLATFSRHIYTKRVENPYGVLKRLLAPIESRYDFVFVDVGPSLGDHMINAIVYADAAIIPVDLGEFAMDAMVRFIEFLDETRREGHTSCQIIGILLTMRDTRSKHEQDIEDAIRAEYGELVFEQDIRRRAKIKEFTAYGTNLRNNVLIDYVTMTDEFINRINRMEE